MLEEIVFIVSDEYKDTLEASEGYKLLQEDMDSRQVVTSIYAAPEWEGEEYLDIEGLKALHTTIYLSDDAPTLATLQNKGCYTIAMYHDGVTGILSGTQYAVEGIDGSEWEYFYKVWQRFAGQPWQIAETTRCTLREMCVDDIEDLYEVYSDERVTRYTESLFAEREKEIQYIRDYIENVYKYYGFGTWLIHRKEDGKLIGRAGFSYRPGYEEAELGFVIGAPFWRQGYAYEVCSFLMELGRNVYELLNIQALVKEENEASISLLEKLGFAYEEDVTLDGETYRRYLSEVAT